MKNIILFILASFFVVSCAQTELKSSAREYSAQFREGPRGNH